MSTIGAGVASIIVGDFKALDTNIFLLLLSGSVFVACGKLMEFLGTSRTESTVSLLFPSFHFFIETVGLLMISTPVFTVLLEFVFLGERKNLLNWVGTLLILCGSAFLVLTSTDQDKTLTLESDDNPRSVAI